MSREAQVKTQSKFPIALGLVHIAPKPQTMTEHKVERPDIPAQLENASHLGHSLEDIHVNSALAGPLIQRQENPEEEKDEEALQMQRGPAAVQRQENPEEEKDKEAVQMQRDDKRVGLEGGSVPPSVESAINRARGGGQPLEEDVQAQMSKSLGYDFSGVRVHTDAEADALNQRLSARAFTTGQDIFFKHGTYEPRSSSDRKLLAHELSHVVQQISGRVRGDGARMAVRPADDALEREADAQANQGVVGKPAISLKKIVQPVQEFNLLQRVTEWEEVQQSASSSRYRGEVNVVYNGDYTLFTPVRGDSRILILSSHGGESNTNIPAPGRMHWYSGPGQMADSTLDRVPGNEFPGTTPKGSVINDYQLTKFQQTGGETYRHVCEKVKNQHWSVLTINEGKSPTYSSLQRAGAFGGVTDIHALHCRGYMDPTHFVLPDKTQPPPKPKAGVTGKPFTYLR